MMKKTVVAVMLLFLISSQMESVEPDASDCMDACSTACVQRDSSVISHSSFYLFPSVVFLYFFLNFL